MEEYDNTITKQCTKCKEIKLKYQDFGLVKDRKGNKTQVRPHCKKCHSQIEIDRRNKTSESKAKWLEKQKEWRDTNKDKIKQNYEENKEKILEKCKEYRDANKEKIKEFKHEYYQREDIKKKKNEKYKARKDSDPGYKLMCNVKSRIHNMLQQNKTNKCDELIGCTKDQLKFWLNYQLKDDMTWDNYGEYWHIDHVIPICFFDLNINNEHFIVFNWSNLRPLPATENLIKNGNIDKQAIINHMNVLETFTSLNSGYQINMETCWWPRVKLGYGNNSQDEEDFESFLKWAIRSKADSLTLEFKKLKIKYKK